MCLNVQASRSICTCFRIRMSWKHLSFSWTLWVLLGSRSMGPSSRMMFNSFSSHRRPVWRSTHTQPVTHTSEHTSTQTQSYYTRFLLVFKYVEACGGWNVHRWPMSFLQTEWAQMKMSHWPTETLPFIDEIFLQRFIEQPCCTIFRFFCQKDNFFLHVTAWNWLPEWMFWSQLFHLHTFRCIFTCRWIWTNEIMFSTAKFTGSILLLVNATHGPGDQSPSSWFDCWQKSHHFLSREDVFDTCLQLQRHSRCPEALLK